ncbi:DUF6007 family protein [Mammaliicoccus sciuri]|uniref:DUF6007 family protein n=1 Tax=Mammaliicoccus sciuri TaxID=1296 RepID=UPI0009C84232|nr:hypothetical protein BS756_11200 [Staphylococcus sp. MB371]
MNHLREIYESMTLLELISFIPMLFLFSYLPAPNLLSIIINTIIVSFCCLGVSFLFYIFKSSKHNK